MGTLCEISAPGAPDAAVSAAFSEIERWDRILSLYKEESEVSTLNRAAGTGPVTVSPELYAAIETALRLARETGGAFDPTMLAVQRGGPANLALTGWSKVRLDPKTRTVTLPQGLGLDFGGIGKGWALDKAAAVLKDAGVERAMFNFGGQVLVIGSPVGAKGWAVTVPGQAQPLYLKDASVAVSGDTERPGHILSPFDGRPVRRAGAVAAVLPGATDADAWSTALYILEKAPAAFTGRLFTDPGIPDATAKGGRS